VSKHFDVVVLGGTLSASILSALFAKRGLRGVLIDQGELESIDGQLLPDIAVADAGSLAMGLVHAELNLKEDFRIKLEEITPPFQAIYPDARLDFRPERPLFFDEMHRAFGYEASTLADLLERINAIDKQVGTFLAGAGDMPAEGFLGRRNLRAWQKKHSELGHTEAEERLFSDGSSALRDIVLGLQPFFTHVDTVSSDNFPVARVCRSFRRLSTGLFELSSEDGLRNVFLGTSERKGFEVRLSAVESIEIKGRVVVIRLAGQRNEITGDVLVDASSDLSGLDALPSRSKNRDLANLLQSARPTGFLHRLDLVVDTACIPPGLGRNALLLDARRVSRDAGDSKTTSEEDRPIWLVRTPGEEAHRTRLTAFHPVSSVEAHATRGAAFHDVLVRRIERLVPFLRQGHLEVSTRPAAKKPLFDPSLDNFMGIECVPVKTPYRNVFIAGPMVLPGLGIEGDYTTALHVADAVQGMKDGKKHPKTLAERARISP
jgi:hypothetical protein